VIVCDDKDRFGRFDAIDLGEVVAPLRRKGVRLVTVAQGAIDWKTFAGRITDAVLQEAKKMEGQAMSRRVITQMLLMARQGKWVGGPVPYAYQVASDPALGKKLVPGEPDKVRVVQLIFRLYGDKGYTIGGVGKELHARGIPDPSGRPLWYRTTIRS